MRTIASTNRAVRMISIHCYNLVQGRRYAEADWWWRLFMIWSNLYALDAPRPLTAYLLAPPRYLVRNIRE